MFIIFLKEIAINHDWDKSSIAPGRGIFMTLIPTWLAAIKIQSIESSLL